MSETFNQHSNEWTKINTTKAKRAPTNRNILQQIINMIN